MELQQGKYQFTLSWLLCVITLTALVLGLSTPPQPPTEEQRMALLGDFFVPGGTLLTLYLVAALIPPILAYGVRRRWHFSIPAIAVLVILSSLALYNIRYDLGWFGARVCLYWCYHEAGYFAACLLSSAIGTYIVCRLLRMNRKEPHVCQR